MKHNRPNLDMLQQHPTPPEGRGAGTGDNSPRGQTTESDLNLKISICENPAEIQDDWQQFERQLSAGHSNSNWALAWYAAQASRKAESNTSPYILVGRSSPDCSATI